MSAKWHYEDSALVYKVTEGEGDAAATRVIATITGTNITTVDESNTGTIDNITATVSEGSYTFTINKEALTMTAGKTVTLIPGDRLAEGETVTLALGTDPTTLGNATMTYSKSSGTATVTKLKTKYTLAEGNLSATCSTETVVQATISNLKNNYSESDVTLNGTKITIKAAALNQGAGESAVKVTKAGDDSDNYTLAMGSDVDRKQDDPTYTWQTTKAGGDYAGDNTVYLLKSTDPYYSYGTNSTTIVYNATSTTNVAHIVNLKGTTNTVLDALDKNPSDGITLGQSVLSTMDGTSATLTWDDTSSGYEKKLKLTTSGTDSVNSTTGLTYGWAEKSRTYSFNGYTQNYYELAGDSAVTYHKAATDVVVSLTGIKTGLVTANGGTPTGLTYASDTGNITIADSALDKKNVVIISDKEGDSVSHKLVIGTGVATDTTRYLRWKANGSSAEYYGQVDAHYALETESTTLKYTSDVKNSIVSLTGLKGSPDSDTLAKYLAVNESDHTITISRSGTAEAPTYLTTGFSVSTGTILLSSAAGKKVSAPSIVSETLTLGSGNVSVTGAWTTGYNLSDENRTVAYSASAPSKLLATISNLSTSIGQTDVGTATSLAVSLNDTGTGTGVITLSREALNNKGVTLTVKAGPTGVNTAYTLKLGTNVNTSSSVIDVWSISGNNNEATFKRVTPSYYTVGTGSTTITYVAEQPGTTFAKITGLANLEYKDNNLGQHVDISGTAVSNASGTGIVVSSPEGQSYTETGVNETYTLYKAVLPITDGAYVKIKEGDGTYTLALPGGGDANTTSKTNDAFVFSGGNATLKADIGAGYTYLDDRHTLKYTAQKNNKALVTFTGLATKDLASGTNVVLSGSEIVLHKSALNGAKVTLTDQDKEDAFKYSLSLASDARIWSEADTSAGISPTKKIWTIANGTAVYKEVIPEYYSIDENGAVIYHKESTVSTLATIKGLTTQTGNSALKVWETYTQGAAGKSSTTVGHIGISNTTTVELITLGTGAASNTFTISAGALTTGNVTLTNGDGQSFKLKLNTGVEGNSETNRWWTVENGAATLHTKYQAGYTLDEEGTKITYHAKVDDKTMAIVNGLDSDVIAGSTTKKVTGVSSTLLFVDANGDGFWNTGEKILNDTVKTDANSRTVLLTAEALKGTKIQLQIKGDDTYTLDKDATVVVGASDTYKWVVNGATATFDKYQNEYYTLNAEKTLLDYTKETTHNKLLTVSGLNIGNNASKMGSTETRTAGSSNTLVYNAGQADSATYLTLNPTNSEVKIAKPVLSTNSVVTLKGNESEGYGSYTFAFDTATFEETGSGRISATSTSVFNQAAKATTITYSTPYTEGYKLTKNNTSIENVKAGQTLLATISGIKGVSSAIINQTSTSVISVATSTASADVVTTFTLSSGALDKAKVSIKDNDTKDNQIYKLAIGAGVDTNTSAYIDVWSVAANNNTKTATLTNYQKGYYALDTTNSETINYTKESKSNTWVVISGLNKYVTAVNSGTAYDFVLSSGTGNAVPLITRDSATKKIQVSAGALIDGNADAEITLTNKTDGVTYTFALESDVAKSEKGTSSWVAATSSKGATYQTHYGSGYRLADSTSTTIKFQAKAGAIDNVTLVGIATDVTKATLDTTGIGVSGSTLTLHNAVLGTAKISISDKKSGYGLALGTDVETRTKVAGTSWSLTEVKNGNKTTASVTYQDLTNKRYYSLDNGVVNYHKETVSGKPFTISGLASGIKASEQTDGTFLITSGTATTSLFTVDTGTAKTVTIDAKALPTTDGDVVTLKNSGNDKYKMVLGAGVASTTYAADSHYFTNAKNVVTLYDKPKADSYRLSDSDTKITFYSATAHAMATISGIDSKIASNTLKTGIAVDYTSNTLTLGGSVLGTAKISVDKNSGFTLKLASGIRTDTSLGNTDVYSLNGTTAAYKSVTPEYYTVDSNNLSIAYHKETPVSTSYTLSGLSSTVKEYKLTDGTIYLGGSSHSNASVASEASIYLSGTNVVVIAGDALSTKKGDVLTLKNAGNTVYKLALGDGATASVMDTSTHVWTKTKDSAEATLQVQFTTGYALSASDTKITRIDSADKVTLATISGLKTGDGTAAANQEIEGVDISWTATDSTSKIVTLSRDILGTGKVQIKGNYDYILALDDNVTTSTNKVDNVWAVTGDNKSKNVTYKNVTLAHYTLSEDKKSVSYTKETAKDGTLFTINGLKGSVDAFKDDDGFLTKLGVGTNTGIVVSSTKIILTRDILPDYDKAGSVVTLKGDSYTFSLGQFTDPARTNVQAMSNEITSDYANSATWTLDKSNVATLALEYDGGYQLSDDKKTVKVVAAGKRDMLTITGLDTDVAVGGTSNTKLVDAANASNAFVTFDSATSKVTVYKGALSTSKVTLKSSEKDRTYAFEFGADVATTPVVSDTWSFGAAGNTVTATLKNVNTDYYSKENNDTAISYHKETANSTHLAITGLKKGTDEASDGIISWETSTKNEGTFYTVTLGKGVLDTANTISLGKYNGRLVLGDGVDKANDTTKSWKKASVDATSANYVVARTSGYQLSSDEKTITYLSAATDVTLVTVNGLGGVSQAALGSSTGIQVSGTELTLGSAVLGTSKITIDKKSGYSLKLEDDVASSTGTAVNGWEVKSASGSKSVIYQNATPAYYTLSDDKFTITYNKAQASTTHFTITGLADTTDVTVAKMSDLITVNEANSEVTIKSATALNGDVAIKGDGYKLVLADGVKPQEPTPSWTVKDGTATLTKTYAVGDYLLSGDGKKITKITNDNKTVTLATITGLDKDVTKEKLDVLTIDGKKKIILTDAVLGTSKVAIKGNYGYSIALNAAVNTSSSSTENKWVISGSNATYKTFTKAYWTMAEADSDDKVYNISYTKEAAGATLATLKGVSSKLVEYKDSSNASALGIKDGDTYTNAVSVSGSNITLKSGAVDKKNITLTNGEGQTFKLVKDGSISAPGEPSLKWSVSGSTLTLNQSNTAGYALDDDSDTLVYTAEATSNKPTVVATLSGVKSGLKATDGQIEGITINNTTKVITLDSRVLDEKKLAIKGKNGYSLALKADGDNAVKSSQQPDADIWEFKNGTATYKTATPAYYSAVTDTDSNVYNINYVKANTQQTLATVSGLNSALVLNGGVISSKSGDNYTAAVTLSGTTIKLSTAALDKISTVKVKEKDTDYKLAFGDDVQDNAKSQETNFGWKKDNKATSATYQSTIGAGLLRSSDGKTITKVGASTKLYATLTGLSPDVTQAQLNDNATDYVKVAKGANADDDGNTPYTVTVGKDALNKTKLALKTNAKDAAFTLALDSGVVSSEPAEKDIWALKDKNGTAVYKQVTPEYYTLDTNTNASVTYTKQKDEQIYATIKGLDKNITVAEDNSSIGKVTGDDYESGVKVTDGTITLSENVLGTGKASITSTNYKLALANGVANPEIVGDASWEANGTTGANRKASVTYGYTLSSDSTTVTYSATANNKVLATISGLSIDKDADLSESLTYSGSNELAGGTFTISNDDILGTGKVTVKPSDKNVTYTFALTAGDNLRTSAVSATEWVTKGTSATLQTYKKDYYSLSEDNKTVNYNKASDPSETFAKVTGIKSGVDLNDVYSSNSFDFTKDQVDNGSTISISGKGEDNNKIEYNFADGISKLTIKGTSEDDVIRTGNGGGMTINAGDGNDEISVKGRGNTVNGGDGNDSVNFNSGGGNTYIYKGGKDEVSGFTSSDKLQLSGSISDVSVSSSSIEITFKNGGTLNVSGSGMNMGTNDKFVYANGSWTRPAEKDSSNLVDSADLIYDDDNFTTNDLSNLVNDSLDNYSINDLTTNNNNLTDLTPQSDMLTYGDDEKK